MLKLATFAVLTITTAALSWTGYRTVAQPADAPQAAASGMSDAERDAAYRHRNNMPNHWQSYVLNQRRY